MMGKSDSLGCKIQSFTEDLCRFVTGVVASDNLAYFQHIQNTLPLELLRYESRLQYNGWEVPKLWNVQKAEIRKKGEIVFDGTLHPLAVAQYSRSFSGELDFETLKAHIVTRPEMPDAYCYHCAWQIRHWAADWAFSVPHNTLQSWGDGMYEVNLETTLADSEMLVGIVDFPGATSETIVFNAHTCHPQMANDDNAGVALLVALFQWLQTHPRHYSYRLVLAPEHLGTVFYLNERSIEEINQMLFCIFVEMPGTRGPLKVASTFLGDLPVDQAFQVATQGIQKPPVFVPWRQGAGNDETVWEAPGYEVPCVELSRCIALDDPFPEYHTNFDTAESLHTPHLEETFNVLTQLIDSIEGNRVMHRKFDGLPCLSHPKYDLYRERPDPAMDKNITDQTEQWGYLQDCFPRYLDGRTTILDIALKHHIPFSELASYVKSFEDKGLLSSERAAVTRRPVSSRK